MTKGTVLVASPSATGSMPEASGSSVPACPARLAVNRRLMTPTACVEVMPTGLSRITQPCTSCFSRFFCFGAVAAVTLTSLILAAFEIALDRRRAQQAVDAVSFGETVVDAKPDVRREFQIDALRDFGAHEFLVPVEGGDDVVGVAAGERHNVDGGEPQVRGHAHLRHGDEMALDHRIVHVAARQHLGDRVANELADAQLALRAAGGCCVASVFLPWHKFGALNSFHALLPSLREGVDARRMGVS